MTGLDDETRAIAEAAAARLGVSAGDAELIHLHSNATVALPSAGLVLRIATSPDAFDRIRGSVRGWLAARGYPCTVPADAEPWIEAGRIVSVWRFEEVVPGPSASMAEFGTLLRKLHDEPVPPFQVRDLERRLGWAVVTNTRAIKPSEDPDVLAIEGDISQPATADRITGDALARFGRIDTLVDIPGVFVSKPFTDYTAEDYALMVGVNLTGFFWLTQRVTPEMLKRNGGHVVNISATLADDAASRAPSGCWSHSPRA